MKSWCCFPLLLLALIASLFRQVKGALYTAEDAVTDLDSSEFEDAITGRPHAWLIEFYASWCGHCQDFAPFYKQFGSEVAYWGDVVKIGAIDCANSDNEDLCTKYEIRGYPSIKYFPPNTQEDDLGVLRESWSKSVESLKADTIAFIEQSQAQMNLTEWPSLDPIKERDLKDLEEKSFIILETEDQFAGREVLLDIHNAYNGSENVYRLLWSENSTRFSSFNYSILPVLIRYTPQNQGLPSKGLDIIRTSVTAPEIEQLVYNEIVGTTSSNTSYQPNGPYETGQADVAGGSMMPGDKWRIGSSHQELDIIRRRYTVSLSDLEKTVVYALTHEIDMQGVLSREQEIALKKFVEVLAAYFPAFSSLIYPIHQINTFPRQHILKEAELLIGDRDAEYNRRPWRACRGSQEQYGGYPCGQWMLWHTLTVSQLREATGSPTQVLEAMLAYIQNFFGCRECADHFSNTTRQGEAFKAIKTYQDGVLYLWDLHNSVNLRLQNTSSDDPVYPKQVFPSPGHCPECYTDVTANRKKNSSAAAATTANLTHESSSGVADVKANVTNQSSASAVGTANLTIESSSAADVVRKNKSSAAAAVSANVTSLPPGAADDISEIAAAAARDFEEWPRQLPLQELVRPKVLDFLVSMYSEIDRTGSVASDSPARTATISLIVLTCAATTSLAKYII